jgi:UDP-2,3-diacylglucosamine pyrophosphatase LpxH
MTRLAVLSDLHLAPPGPLSSFHAGRELVALLGKLRSEHHVSTLVLAGDTFDFLAVETRPATLFRFEIPAFIDGVFGQLAGTDWGRYLFASLGALVRAGTDVVVLPGNHDPELAHPTAAATLRTRCGLPVDEPRLQIAPGPLRRRLGELEVVVGHGHRGDPWNDIDPAAIAQHANDTPLELPPGSQLVLGPMRAFRERYPFVDALKPEGAVVLLLWYLDPRMARLHFPSAGVLSARALLAALQRRFSSGRPVLAPTPPGDPGSPATIGDELAAAVFESLYPGESLRDLEAWLDGHVDPSVPGTLAAHGGAKALLRAALARFSSDSCFDRAYCSAVDRAIIKAYLPADGQRRVVIAGHTHAARELVLDAQRTYLNTGTWTDADGACHREAQPAAREPVEAVRGVRGEKGRQRSRRGHRLLDDDRVRG